MHGHKLSLWVRICYDLELSHSGYLASYTLICTTIVTIQYHSKHYNQILIFIVFIYISM